VVLFLPLKAGCHVQQQRFSAQFVPKGSAQAMTRRMSCLKLPFQLELYKLL
jgi:hypothetical protein